MFYTAMARDADWGKDIPDMLRNEEWSYAVFTAAKQHLLVALLFLFFRYLDCNCGFPESPHCPDEGHGLDCPMAAPVRCGFLSSIQEFIWFRKSVW